jgi:hypothetical protein
MPTSQEPDDARLSQVRQRWSQRASERSTRPMRRPQQVPAVAIWAAAACIAVLLLGVFTLLSRGEEQTLAPPTQASLGAVAPASSALPTATADGRTRLSGAIIAYGAPSRTASCVALGAIEPGRSFTPREERAGWARLSVDGSGDIWTNAPLPGARIGVTSRLKGAIVAYAAPPISSQSCATVIGAIEPGRVYSVLEQTAGWTRLKVEGSGEVWTDAAVK